MTVHPVHRSQGPLANALASLPSWVEARDRLAALESFSVPSQLPETLEARISALIEGTLSGADMSPDQILAEAAAIKGRFEAEQLLVSTATRLRGAAVGDMDVALSSGGDQLLRHLHRQLSDLLAEATEVARVLGSVRTAEQAIDADKVEPWQRLGDLRGGYAAIRNAQTAVFNRTSSQSLALRQRAVAFIQHPREVDQDFVARRAGQPVKIKSDDGWVTRNPRPVPWPDLSQPEALDWLVAHPEAGPWVPTERELTRAEEVIAAAARDFQAEQRGIVTGTLMHSSRTAR